MDEAGSICYYYNTPGGCWNEGQCRFQHIRDDGGAPRPLCRFFGTKQGCWYGSDCYFTHVEYVGPKQDQDAFEGSENRLETVEENPQEETDANNNEMKPTEDEESNENDDQSEDGDTKRDETEETTEKKHAATKPWKTGRRAKKGQKRRKNRRGKGKKVSGKTTGQGSAADKATLGRTGDDEEDASKTTKSSTTHKNEEENRSSKNDAENGEPEGKMDHVKCGECNLMFRDGDEQQDLLDQLENHYMEMLGKADRAHTKLFHSHPRLCDDQALCGACGRIFWRVDDLLRHLGAKYRLRRHDGHCHRQYFTEIAHQFIDRDLGMTSDDEGEMVEYLRLLVSLGGDSCIHGGSSDSDSDGTEDTGLGLFISHHLRRLSKLPSDRVEEESDERAANYGFTQDEVYELMCQGIKPWDREACSALNVIYGLGGSDIFDYEF